MSLWTLQGCDTNDSTEAPVGDKVNASLVLCVSPTQSQSTATTRQSEAVAQAQEAMAVTSFRGIKNIENEASPQPFTLIPLGQDGTVLMSTIPVFSEPQKAASYRHYIASNTELFIGTEKFLCYTKADPDGETDKFKNGSIIPNLNDRKPRNIRFDLEPICTADCDYGVAVNLAKYLNSIANHEAWETLDLRSDFLGLHTSFKNESDKIAGSSANIKALVNELYHNVYSLPVGDSEKEIIAAKTKILSAITTDVTVEGSGVGLKITNLNGTTSGRKREGYPNNIGLPDGAAAMVYGTEFVNITEGNTQTPLSDHSRFVYPAELYYYSYGPIKTSNVSKETYYSGLKWEGEKDEAGVTVVEGVLDKYENDDAIVASDTRSVAIKNPLNYAVSCMKTTIKADATYDETEDKWFLEDNTEDSPKKVYLVNAEGNLSFPLTGVLVGGQYQQLYNFEPVSDPPQGSTAPKPTEYIIYDREVVNGIYLKTATTEEEMAALIPNYTLVFQSRDDKPIDVVLEFTNNSDVDFKGYGGIVYKGTKFYLIGQVWPQPTRPEDKWHRVFTKDHKTVLNLNIKSLKNAYNVIPDLKTAQYAIKVANVAVKSWVDAGIKTSELYNW